MMITTRFHESLVHFRLGAITFYKSVDFVDAPAFKILSSSKLNYLLKKYLV